MMLMLMLMLEVAGTQGSLGCFAFACCFDDTTPFSLATEDGHDDNEGLAKQRA